MLAQCADGRGRPGNAVSIEVRKDKCTSACTVDRYDVVMRRGGCLFAWRNGLSAGPFDLRELDLEEGEELSVQVLGRCGADPCAQCEAIRSVTTELGASTQLVLDLVPVAACTPVLPMGAPCTPCLPSRSATEDSYCKGDAQVSCSAAGEPVITDCLGMGCRAGSCQSCVMQTFYSDGDADGYGDGTRPTQACELGAGQSANDDDCNDANKDVHPGQTAFFAAAIPGSGGFDYNCDGQAEQQEPGSLKCSFNTQGGACTGRGWITGLSAPAPAPNCGETGTFFEGTCASEAGGACLNQVGTNGSLSFRVIAQSCR